MLKTLINKLYKIFSSTYFKEQVLGLLLIFPGESFLGGMEPWTHVCLLWIHSLTWLEQFKQMSIVLTGNIYIFLGCDVISNFDNT